MSAMIPVEEIPTEFGTISITQDPATGALTYTVDGQRQGAMDKNGISLAYYIHAFYGLLVQANASSVLMIGGACCTLGVLLAGGQGQLTIVDINPASFDVARRHFGLPQSAICHVAEGEVFLRSDTGLYDAIVLDAFHGEHIPPHLQTPDFFALVRERLAPGGAVFANLLVKNPRDDCADQIAKNMKQVWPDVRVLDTVGPADRNAIVMAGAVSHLRAPRLLVRPQTNPEVIQEELARMQFRAWKSSRWAFGG
jgi:spermidine synthase